MQKKQKQCYFVVAIMSFMSDYWTSGEQFFFSFFFNFLFNTKIQKRQKIVENIFQKTKTLLICKKNCFLLKQVFPLARPRPHLVQDHVQLHVLYRLFEYEFGAVLFFVAYFF